MNPSENPVPYKYGLKCIYIFLGERHYKYKTNPWKYYGQIIHKSSVSIILVQKANPDLTFVQGSESSLLMASVVQVNPNHSYLRICYGENSGIFGVS